MQPGKIFFSYSRVDAAFALKLADDLRQAGTNIWIDQIDIRPSEPWDKEIEKALEATDCLLTILSGASVASDNVLNEINYALETKKRVLPILIETNIKKPFTIRRLQHIDFTVSYDKALQQLLTSLHGAKSLPVKGQGVSINGRWSSQALTNPFDRNDKYTIHFDFEVMGNVLVGTINRVSATERNKYDIKKGITDGKVTDSTISFATVEQSVVGVENVTFRNFYIGALGDDEIRFMLQSDRPWGFPGQKFVAERDP